MKKFKYKTIILSDVHLGTFDCKIEEVNDFLKYTESDKLILNGDIIDGWRLKGSGRWGSSGWTTNHTRFVRLVLKKMEKKNTEVVYLRGNHDDILSRFLPLSFVNLRVVEEYVHTTPKGDYLVVHGDVFDAVTMNYVFLAHIGDIGYKWLMRLNRFYNRWRAWRGKEYFSLSKYVKGRVKSAVSCVSRYERQIAKLARKENCVGVICGHIHTPADKMIDDIHYLNSGDWVESLTALVEHMDGTFEIIEYQEFRRRLEALRGAGAPPMKGATPDGDTDEAVPSMVDCMEGGAPSPPRSCSDVCCVRVPHGRRHGRSRALQGLVRMA